MFGWAQGTIRRVVTVTRTGYASKWGDIQDLGCSELGKLGAIPGPNEPTDPAAAAAAILFTSGSTGPPKGVVYTHAMFRAQVDLLRSTYGIEPGEVDLCTFPLFALFAPALGLTSVVPEMDFTRPGRVDPSKILGPIAEFGVANLFGSPALIRRVGDHAAARGIRLPTLRRVISAGAPVPARVLARFAEALAPGVEIFTPYGATESLPVCSIGSGEILAETRGRTDAGAGVCVGRPVEGMRVAILPIRDEPIAAWSDDLDLPNGAIGEIAVAGPVVSRSYFRRDEATALAKIADPASGAVWHRMGDVGYRDAQGRIWFCGRKSHRVQTPGGTLFTIPVEGIFNAHPLVARTALVGVGPPGQARPVALRRIARPAGRPTLGRHPGRVAGAGPNEPDHAPGSNALLRHPRSRSTSATTPRSSANSWRPGRRGSSDDRPRHRRRRFPRPRDRRRLLARGDSVRSLARGDYPDLRVLGVEAIRGDLADPDAVDRAAEGVDVVFHVAAKAGVWGPWAEYHRANVVGTRNVVEACRRRGVGRLVFTSSPSVVAGARRHRRGRRVAPVSRPLRLRLPRDQGRGRATGPGRERTRPGTVALRPHLIWGPGDNHLIPRIVARARAGRLRRIGRRPNRVDSIYIDDAADAHLLAADRLGPGLARRRSRLLHLARRPLAALGPDQRHPPRRRPPARHPADPAPALAQLAGSALETAYRAFACPASRP